jgi:hypothetical protein
MEKIIINKKCVGFVEELGRRWVGHSNFHNMREYFGQDVFDTKEEAKQFVLDLNEGSDETV